MEYNDVNVMREDISSLASVFHLSQLIKQPCLTTVTLQSFYGRSSWLDNPVATCGVTLKI